MSTTSTDRAAEAPRMKVAIKEFFIDGIDLLGQHHSPEDLASSMQFELDLLTEGDESQLKTKAQIARAKRYVAKYGDPDWST